VLAYVGPQCRAENLYQLELFAAQVSILLERVRRAAAQSLSEILAASLLEPRLKRYLLLMALRDIALELLRELESTRESEAHESLQNNLMNFLELYFGAKEESK
jgi:hypothetical protein